ncbi:hypothetical protein QRX50_17130 [Amycolatopsis carbonis]|uniref:Amidohydrolase-related domain-containing protein n=1 Tax=Amycolatopsis carbonis TaxID=715471 RepID=A0A9Y2MUZ6_9PSEU|nr:amidohydrolase family protein [Amycolatopsis sp. 2-15]WIX82360.1 hypothetical protein QRX50_17130 [Amycolatopsis sp. 2-15]
MVISGEASVFGGRKRQEELEAAQRENLYLRGELQRLGALGSVAVQQEVAALTQRLHADQVRHQQQTSAMNAESAQLQTQLATLRAEVVETDDARLMQEVGVYQYRHVLSDAEAYKAELERLKVAMKDMTRTKSAVEASSSFHYNNSLAQGRKECGEHHRDTGPAGRRDRVRPRPRRGGDRDRVRRRHRRCHRSARAHRGRRAGRAPGRGRRAVPRDSAEHRLGPGSSRHAPAAGATGRLVRVGGVPPRVRLLGPRGLTFDAWCYHPQLGEVTDLARAFPDTRIVLDHCGGPLGVGRHADAFPV